MSQPTQHISIYQPPKNKSSVESQFSDKLIYGRNTTERVVSVEIYDDVLEVFTEDDQGNVSSKHEKLNLWILSNEAHSQRWKRLKGDLHFRYGRLCNSVGEFLDLRHKLGWKGYSVYDYKENVLIKEGYTYFKGMKHDEVSILSFDIETTGLNHNDSADVLLIANTFRKNGKITRKMFTYDDYKTRGAMFKAWTSWVRSVDPSIVCGHNIVSFDLPYIKYCADREGVEINLGRDSGNITFAEKDSFFRIDQTRSQKYNKVKIFGREVIDTLFLAWKYDVERKYESYGLKNIVKQENMEVEGRVFYDAGEIRHKYKDPKEWEKIKQYALYDADDSLNIYDKMSPPFFYLTQSVPKSFQTITESATGSQINSVMVRAYLQDGHSIPKATSVGEYTGGTSIGNPGIYSNVFKVDVASMYPSIILEYNVYDPKKDPEGFFLEIVGKFTKRRLKHKALAKTDKYYDGLQQSEKIFINSCYGFLSTEGLNFNIPEGAAFVTEKGREILQQAIDWTKTNNMILVNADTDSISFSKGDGSIIIDDERALYLAQINDMFPERIKWSDDGYYRKVIVASAKNYVLDDGKKITYKGNSIKASIKEPALKEFIKKIIDSILKDKTDFVQVYDSYVKDIMKITDIKRWSMRKTITSTVLKSTRTNELKVRKAIEGSDYFEGDRCYMFYKPGGTLCLLEKFDGEYDKKVLLEKLWKTTKVFEKILDRKMFLNYSLKRNEKLLGNF